MLEGDECPTCGRPLHRRQFMEHSFLTCVHCNGEPDEAGKFLGWANSLGHEYGAKLNESIRRDMVAKFEECPDETGPTVVEAVPAPYEPGKPFPLSPMKVALVTLIGLGIGVATYSIVNAFCSR